LVLPVGTPLRAVQDAGGGDALPSALRDANLAAVSVLQLGMAFRAAVVSLRQLVKSPTVAVQVADPLLAASMVGSDMVVV
jgi:hypothetical protein